MRDESTMICYSSASDHGMSVSLRSEVIYLSASCSIFLVVSQGNWIVSKLVTYVDAKRYCLGDEMKSIIETEGRIWIALELNRVP
jgi:hypothetical protein